ncbi:MAG: RdgB/HAM1 family non-canonical purine NTP pyrophosphatase [Candidatus Cloacimonetes bacterium]|nr:RdgB/HAM1 family non-canonical purine NTP pyrophosphatase [Candidatus Cloacimonadota bacterium]
MIRELLIASNNRDKLVELKSLLGALPYRLFCLQDFPELPATIEDRDTIAGNAMKKALEAAKGSGMLALADDTGLFIIALDNAPGVYAARYAGEQCSYADNRHKVLSLMQGISDRRASFRTAVALAAPDGIIAVVEGVVEGKITESERGASGFGYDSIFEVEGLTYAEMDDDAKNRISHRGAAIARIIPILQNLINM